MTDLDEIERLLANATPGPWQYRDDYTTEGFVTIIGSVDGEYIDGKPECTYDVVCRCEDEYGERLANVGANVRAIVALRNAAPALIAELKALRVNAKANNDLARMYKAQADELRGKCAALADALDYVAPSLPVLRDMLKRAKMPRGANTAADMVKTCEAALAQYRRNAAPELIAAARCVAELEAENMRLREALEVVENPDKLLCCTGYHCGCQGATVGGYAAWVMRDDRNAALSDLIASTADEYGPQAIAKEIPDAD